MPILTREQLDEYRSTGCLVVSGLVPEEPREELLSALVALARKFTGPLDASSWRDAGLHERLASLRREKPAVFGDLYNSIQTSVPLMHLFVLKGVTACVGELLGDPAHVMSVTAHMLRMDASEDTRNRLEWHQDSAYFPVTESGDHGLVCWLPMLDVSPENGTLEFLPGSQELGYVPVQLESGPAGHSDQYPVPGDVLERYPVRTLLAKAGDAAFFHMDIVHRSGFNRSGRFRFNAGARFHRILADDFYPGRNTYTITSEKRPSR